MPLLSHRRILPENSESAVVSQKQAQWDEFCIGLVRRKGVRRQQIDFKSHTHSLFLNLEGAARSGETFLDGRRHAFAARPQGSLVYIPPGVMWHGWDEGDQNAAYLLISAEERFADKVFGDDFVPARFVPNMSFQDVGIEHAARKIYLELAQLDSASGLIVEGQLTTIFGHLLRRSRLFDKHRKGGLAPAVLKRITQRIDAALEEKVSLGAIAQEFGYSAAHLSRAFKQSTGLSPQAHFNKVRLDRASELLRTTSKSVTEIAHSCGYSSGSHLSSSFHKAFGISPIAYRALWAE
ncbi:helix-turn-helix transcriptional regulator [Rhizobium pusense]|uniref:helix-turn-helix transcriptional regulator n=1 Tax=Agrobacterium pusense TaxID=648995 RepID=UPI001C6E5A80|nr:AraC family transcriptional regulator [Agrobacterium pusense]MBW9080545.1 helix-turn-helix transcriptional regulator [Agrobacterium pusense]